MALFFKIQGEHLIFYGDTYNYRNAIKSLGARYNGVDKTWIVKDSEDARNKASQFAKSYDDGQRTTSDSPHESSTQSSRDASISVAANPALGQTVSQLLTDAEALVAQGFPTPIWVIGEIQSFSRRAGGTLYFDLAEFKSGAHQTATVTIKCTAWQSTVQWLIKRHGPEKIQDIFADGNQLRALVHVKLYKDRGQLTLSIEDIDPSFTQGALALQRAELIKKLKAQGLDKKNKSLPMPAFPFKVALITAPDSRAKSDFEHQLVQSGEFPGEIMFIPCAMQGERVPHDVTVAIQKAINAFADVIVMSRGGGSAADLRWFDGEEIALAIAHCPIPIIAAIGHHDDTCVAEEIAHLREKTPTAAADKILEVFRDTRTLINERAHTLATALDRHIQWFDRTQSDVRERLVYASEVYFNRHKERLLALSGQVERSFTALYAAQSNQFIRVALQLHMLANKSIQVMADQVHAKEQQLTRLDPSPWLDAGWTQLSIDGNSIVSISQVSQGDTLKARLRDGVLQLNVTELKPTSPERS